MAARSSAPTGRCEEGGGRPLTKGNGRGLVRSARAAGRRRAASTASRVPTPTRAPGCHNPPFGIAGGGGDFVTNVFVLGQRFDFVDLRPQATCCPRAARSTSAASAATLATVANSRGDPGHVRRRLHRDAGARDDRGPAAHPRRHAPRRYAHLVSKGIEFGRLVRRDDGLWDVSQVTGLPRLSLITATPLDPPTLIVRPWHQAGNVVSLREFTNNAFNHHHGIQTDRTLRRGHRPGRRRLQERADARRRHRRDGLPGGDGRAGPGHPQPPGDRARGAARRAQVRASSAAPRATCRRCRCRARLDLQRAQSATIRPATCARRRRAGDDGPRPTRALPPPRLAPASDRPS